MNVSVILPTYRNPKFLDICLRSGLENRVESDTKVIVIVDGYADESADVLKKYSVYQGLQILTFEQNRGLNSAINLAIWNSSTKYAFVINDDNVFPKNWDRRLNEEVHTSEERFGERMILTVDQIEPTGPSMFCFPIKNLGLTPDTFQYDEWLTFENSIQENVIKEDGHIYPFLVQKRWFMATNGADIFYSTGSPADWDMFLKWELLDFKFPRTRAMHLYHFGSTVLKKGQDAPVFNAKEVRATAEYQYKWGVPIYNKPGVNSKVPPDGQFRGFKV